MCMKLVLYKFYLSIAVFPGAWGEKQDLQLDINQNFYLNNSKE